MKNWEVAGFGARRGSPNRSGATDQLRRAKIEWMKRVALLIGLATAMAYGQSAVTNEIRSQFAPSGTLRAGINYANPLLATRDEKTGELSEIGRAHV